MTAMPQTIRFQKMRCPECGNETAFTIDMTASISVQDNEYTLSTDTIVIRTDEPDPWTGCDGCGHSDANRDFTDCYDDHHQDDE